MAAICPSNAEQVGTYLQHTWKSGSAFASLPWGKGLTGQLHVQWTSCRMVHTSNLPRFMSTCSEFAAAKIRKPVPSISSRQQLSAAFMKGADSLPNRPFCILRSAISLHIIQDRERCMLSGTPSETKHQGHAIALIISQNTQLHTLWLCKNYKVCIMSCAFIPVLYSEFTEKCFNLVLKFVISKF